MSRRYRTALVGMGRIGAGYSHDALLARHYRYAAHAQVLADHPAFAWEAAVDLDQGALAMARDTWDISYTAASVSELVRTYSPEVIVLATPPKGRLEALQACPDLKAVLCEKPLDLDLQKAKRFLDYCKTRDLPIQVNYWRRCDDLYRELAAGGLTSRIGDPQALYGVYGNGLVNNGGHLIDTFRMLIGEIMSVRALTPLKRENLPSADDFEVACQLNFENGHTAIMLPLDFRSYRENGFVFWGTKGRLEILNEDLTVLYYGKTSHRAVKFADELTDKPKLLHTTVGEALFRVYDNLAAAIEGAESLQSPVTSAWRTALVIDSIRRSADTNGQLVLVDETAS